MSSLVFSITIKSSTMKFRTASLSLLALSVPASAWAPVSAARPAFTSMASALFSTSTEVVGEEATESFRLKFKTDDGVISPWHDIPLKGDGDSYNMVVEIPKMTKAKMEVANKEHKTLR